MNQLKVNVTNGKSLWLGLFIPPTLPLGPLGPWMTPFRGTDDDPHVTVLYLGKGVDHTLVDRVARVVNRLWSTRLSMGKGIRAELTGAGYFWRRSSEPVLVSLINSFDLTQFRSELIRELSADGIDLRSDSYGYLPHCTLRQPLPVELEALTPEGLTPSGWFLKNLSPIPFEFSQIHLVAGNERVSL